MNSIKYYSYANSEGDNFGCDRLEDKKGWIEILNGWQEADDREQRYKVSEWGELEPFWDFRGVILAEPKQAKNGWRVTYTNDNDGIAHATLIDHDGTLWNECDHRPHDFEQWEFKLRDQLTIKKGAKK